MSNALKNDPAKRPSVLLVEDDAAVRRSLQLLLRSRDIDVRAYASALPALADDHAGSACLVTDLVLPEVDGIALLREMRARGWAGPAILMSGHLTPESSARAQETGFDVILRKPLADSLLLDTVLSLIASADKADHATPQHRQEHVSP